MISELDRQMLNLWRRRLLGRARAPKGPRIAVVGNCQSLGVAYGMQMLAPDAQVDRFTIAAPALVNVKTLTRVLAEYDHVFAYDFERGYVRKGSGAHLREHLPRFQPMPSLLFSAFHPDTIYVLDATRGGAAVEGPTRAYHSAIALFAFLRGMSLEQTKALFARNVYEALGYLDIWDAAAQELLASARSADLDISADFVRWSRKGVFMYSMNHPKAHVLFDLARALMTRAGLAMAPVDFDQFAVDELVRGAVYPVYPEIAEHYGWKGSYLFKEPRYDLSMGVGKFLDLEGFLAASFKLYGGLERARLTGGRMEQWLADPEVGRLFDYYAAENLARRYASA